MTDDPNEIIISQANINQFSEVMPDGEIKGMGLIPRDYTKFPVGYYKAAQPFMMPLIPRDEWQDRLDAQKAAKAQISDIRNMGDDGKMIPAMDQGNQGYCWAHGPAMAVMLVRALQGLPYIELSAYAVACMIKNYANQGGYGAEAMEFIAERGIPSTEYWPQGSKDPKHNNKATWDNAEKHKVTEWQDHHQKNKEQLVTCLLSNIPVSGGFNWKRHEVVVMDLVELSPFRVRILNSWGPTWNRWGTCLVEGESYAVPDAAVSPRVVHATPNE